MPGPQFGLLAQDVSSILDIENLRLVEAACETVYPDFSEAASVAVPASDAGTSDRRNLIEMLQDTDIIMDTQQGGPRSLPQTTNASSFSRLPMARLFLFSG